MSDPASATPLSRLIGEVQAQHPDDPAGAGARLVAGHALLPGEAGEAELYVRTAEHVLLGHLADAPALVELLGRVPAGAADAAVARARLAADLVDDLAALQRSAVPLATQIGALYNAALALTRRGAWSEVMARMDAAAGIAARHAGDRDVQRAQAATAHNIAADIRYDLKPGHRADGAKLGCMLEAARRSREAWALAGGWMEVERAEYQLALCHAAAGRAEAAVAHAQACLAICEDNDADAYERLFAHEALARAHASADQHAAARLARERMAALLQEVEEPASRDFAQGALRQLDHDLGAAAVQ